MPGFPSAIRVFALTYSRRNVVQRYPWLISFSLDVVTMGDNHEGLPELIDVYEGDEQGRGYNSITAFDR